MDRDPKQMTDSLCPAPQSAIRLLWRRYRDWRGQTASVSTSAEQVLVMVVCSQETHSLKHTLTLERIGGFAAPVQSAVIETGGVDCCCYPDTRLMSKHWKTEASELFGKELGCQTRSNSMLRVIARTCNDLSPNPRPASVGASSLGAVPIAVAAVENKGETDDTQVRQR